MATFVARRVVAMVPVLILISLISFLTLRVLPGDPARGILGPEAPPDAVRSLHKSLGLDQPLPQQYVNWAAGTVTGDFGRTHRTGQTVSSLIGERLPVT